MNRFRTIMIVTKALITAINITKWVGKTVSTTSGKTTSGRMTLTARPMKPAICMVTMANNGKTTTTIETIINSYISYGLSEESWSNEQQHSSGFFYYGQMQ